MHHTDRNANASLAATRAINGQSAIARAKAREAARRERNKRELPSTGSLLALFIFLGACYAVSCIFLPATL